MSRQHLTSWLFVGALIVLCGVLGILQYRWIGEVSVAARERLRNSLQANLEQLGQDFNSEITTACRQLIPAGAPDPQFAEAEVERRYEQWKSRPLSRQIVERVALAVPHDGDVELRIFDWDKGRFEHAAWPDSWQGARQRFEARASGMSGIGAMMQQGRWDDAEPILESPLFLPQPMMAPGMPPFGGGRREMSWMLFELNLPQIRSTVLPEVIERHLGTDYEALVVSRLDPAKVIYLSDPDAERVRTNPDAASGLLEVRLMEGGGRGGRGGRGRTMGGGPGMDGGRWQIFVRHRAGSLEAVVAQARWRNLAVTGGVLLLLVVTLGALLRFTRNAQRLAQLQMDFVAGVSHELRTPLTALYTAGHNLRGKVAQQPSQVERYGEMIQHESARLKDLVEQVLRFAGAGAGRIVQELAPASVPKIIQETIDSSRALLHSTHCSIETEVAENLPTVMADSLALKHALQNLLTNAVKYGAKDNCWVRLSAAAPAEGGVEIRVADRGPGIPEEEQARIFDAFYRGKRALQEQIHGAGLGLNLVKKIVEAHGGTIRVHSAPGAGAEFIVRIPAAPESVMS